MKAVLLAVLLAAPAIAGPRAASRAIPAADLLIRQSSPALVWRWRAPPEVATQPPLLAALRTMALRDATRARAAATAGAVSARKAGIPFRGHETVIDWSRAADTPRLLALISETYSYTGGAHGNTGFGVRLWDKTARRSIGIETLFSDWPRARKLIEPGYCQALAEAQRAKRGTPPSGGGFDACPRLSEQPIVPWGGLGARAGQYRVLLAPYVAGPYAEGAYLVTVPWPETVRALVKPAWREDLFGDAG